MITLTNGVQVPENAVQLRTTAPMDGYYVTQPLQLVQYDETLPVAAVQLTYQNQPYIPPTGAEFNVRMGKPDGTTVYNPCLGMDSSGIVYFAFTQQMTIVAGTGTLTVEVTDSGVKNSAPIIVNVAPNPVPEGAISSTDEFLTLQEILQQAEQWGQIVQANAANIQEVVDNLPAIEAAPAAAQQAAASATAAQQAAQEALGFRTFFSAVTPDANGNLDPSRPMTVGPAASLTIESAGDRIESVTALGFTTQAGTGDPSPTNVRAITCGGLKLVAITFDGSEDEGWQLIDGVAVGASGSKVFYADLAFHAPSTATSETVAVAFFDWLQTVSQNQVYDYSAGDNVAAAIESGTAQTGRVFVRVAGIFTVPALQAYLAQNPILAWIQPADESQATGLYAPIPIQSGEYRATCLELTAPLCDGDSVVNYIKSGCDKVVTFDGSEDEGWILTDSGKATKRFGVASGAPNAVGLLGSWVSETFSSAYTVADVAGQSMAYVIVYPKGYIDANMPGIESLQVWREYLSAHPLTVWYRSTNYTPAADIPVSLETHKRWRAGLSSDLTVYYNSDKSVQAILKNAPTSKDTGATALCSIAKYQEQLSGSGFYLLKSPMSVFFGGAFTQSAGWSSASDAKAFFDANAVTIVYELAIPITYAHPAVVLEASTGDQLTYTVTGQSGGQVSVALKPFQDGGNAKQLGGLTLAALQNLLVPVGYIFSWAPASGGPDLSTPTKVAEYFGFGTWQAYGAGQVLVGVDSGQTEFATVGKTGGEKAHTLTAQELPNESLPLMAYGSNPVGIGQGDVSTEFYLEWGSGNSNGTLSASRTDGGQAHNNLQPYITVYRWQRIA